MKDFPESFAVGRHMVGDRHPCLIIAEAGVNHLGSLQKAFDLVDLAVQARADIFKLQHFVTDKLIGPSAPEWRDRLRSKQLSNEAVASVKQRCEQNGITFLCTPHDEDALEYLDTELRVEAFKIGSGEIENWPFLAKVARKGKPIILSTGMYSLQQIKEAIDVIRDNGRPPLGILHCVTSYPAPASIINLRVMETIREFFPGPVGYSDHTVGAAVPLAAVALGAKILEKHITLDRDVPNAQDWKVSCDASSLQSFVADIRKIESALGTGEKTLSPEEQQSILWARKSLTATTAISKGTVISQDMLTAQRPGTGIPPSRLTEVVGRKAARDIAKGSTIEALDLGLEL